MGYAAGGGEGKMGVVLEVRQGMVNRGADLKWLSQYPHECECALWPRGLAQHTQERQLER